MPPRNYIFNHFPKTGGTSLLAILRDNLEPAEISPHLGDHEIRLRPATRFENYRLIAGHFSLVTQMGFCHDRYSVTLLREPIKRIFSSYIFCRTLPVQNLLTSKARELPFADIVLYFQDSPLVIHNPYCHHFAALGKDFPGYPADTAGLLAIARQNLAAFDFVGICEELERCAHLLCHELGWRLPTSIPFENRSSSETCLGEIEPQTMEILQRRNQLDFELYQDAVRLFHAREVGAARSDTAVPRRVERNRFVSFPTGVKMERRTIIQSVSAMWVREESPAALEIEVDFTTIAPIAELSLGTLVTDADGRIVWGTSTAIEKLHLHYEVGRNSRVVFMMQCNLPVGEYSVTVALSEQRRLGFHENWIDCAGSFTVAPPQSAVSPGAYSAELLQFWSTVRREGSGTRPPWRSEHRLDGQIADRGAFAQDTSGQEPSRAARPLSPYLANPRSGFHAQGYIDVDARLSNPRVHLQLAHNRVDSQTENRRRVYVTVTNLGDETLSSRYVLPVNVGYYWMSGDINVKHWGGLRSSLPFDVLPGRSADLEVMIDTPPDFGSPLLCITLVQEHVCWFDERDPSSRLILRIDGMNALAA